ncbi:MAG: type IX secretion system membrane protein PorP/SprF [Elusimicrobiota bacterium]
MKKIIFITLSLSAIYCLIATNSYSAFEDMDGGPRVKSMAGAFVAQSDDVNSIFYNPAGIIGIKRKEILLTYENLLIGLSDNSNIAHNLIVFGSPIKYKTQYLGNACIGYNNLSLNNLYNENLILFSCAHRFKNNLSALSAGLNFGIMTVSYSEDEYTKINPVFENVYRKTGFNLDIGAIYNWKNINFGISIMNLNEPDLGLKYSNKVSRKINFGVSVKQEASIWNAEITSMNKDLKLKIGTERLLLPELLKQKILLRTGINIGSREYRNISVGTGFKDKNYLIDYSFIYPLGGISGTIGSHQLGLTYRWGESIEEEAKVELSKLLEASGYIEKARFAEKLLPSEPVEISQQERKQAQELIASAKKEIDAGYYKNALEKLKAARQILKDAPAVNELIIKIEPIAQIIPEIIAVDKKDSLLRKGIDKYLANNGESALNFMIYASQLWSQDENIKLLKDIIMEKFSETSPTVERVLPGITIVDQLLQDVLGLIRSSRFVQAVVVCEKILEVEPDNVIALTRQGSAYWAMNKKEMAKKIWEKVLKLDPNNKEIIEFFKK